MLWNEGLYEFKNEVKRSKVQEHWGQNYCTWLISSPQTDQTKTKMINILFSAHIIKYILIVELHIYNTPPS